MIIDFYDTSALLAKPELLNTETLNNYISHFVIKELEDIKQSNKSEDIKASAREVARVLRSKMSIRTDNIDYKKLERIKKKNSWLPQNTDGDIIAEAIFLRENGNQVCFWTADYNMYLFAKDVVSYINFIDVKEKKEKEPWAGWGKYYPNENDMNILYSEPTMNILGAKINEYCEIFEGSELKDVLRWDGERYCKLKYSNFRSPLGQNISPRNLEQKFLFDLLQNKDIKVSLITGKFGTGKSMLALAHSLWQVQKGEYDKIVFIKNNIQLKDTENIGALPGNEIEKIYPYLQQIGDHTGPIMLDDMIEQNIIEPVHLGFLRGRDIKNSIIYCDEVENMTTQHIQLLLGRVSQGSKLILVGDLKQCDRGIFEKNSGIIRLTNRLAGNPLFGCVKLIKTERSETAALADLLD